MVKFKFAVLAAAVIASGAASAATQGTQGATSTGTFTNTFSGATAQVQVLALKDALVTPSSSKVKNFYADSVGALDRFCVVNTAGGATKLSFSNEGGGNTGGFFATATDGSTFGYRLSVWADGVAVSSPTLSTTGFIVPATKAVSNSANCGDGNVYKSVIQNSGFDVAKVTKTYTDTVTVIATPQ